LSEARLVLKTGREKSVRQRHPWVFSGAIEKVIGEPELGETLEVVDRRGSWLARAGYSPHSQIAARIWTWDQNQQVDREFFHALLTQALTLRRPLEAYTNGYRLIHAENDGLPGIIVDRYDGFLVVQFLSAAADRWKPVIVDLLGQFDGVQGVFERSDADVRAKEHLPPATGPVSGAEPPARVDLREGEWNFVVDVHGGHKTGFYLDQRDNRKELCGLISSYARGGEILNVFSYTGAFSVVSYSGGAGSVLNVDSSDVALELARDQLSRNKMPFGKESFISGNAFEILRKFRDESRQFDVVILDPPKFATMKKDIPRASRAYKDINWLAMRILRQNGILVTFSCSGLVSEDLFQKIIFSAALDARREAQILKRVGQPLDHPVRLTFPEGQYLKGFICRVV
jgi:23S rRNA (cytosine1962-C5)-methyltransferase